MQQRQAKPIGRERGDNDGQSRSGEFERVGISDRQQTDHAEFLYREVADERERRLE
ncbi:hypothetical protein D3C84_1247810 [compost metagenome]